MVLVGQQICVENQLQRNIRYVIADFLAAGLIGMDPAMAILWAARVRETR
jgi:hypothetical protein